jgi:hypothetical protein
MFKLYAISNQEHMNEKQGCSIFKAYCIIGWIAKIQINGKE